MQVKYSIIFAYRNRDSERVKRSLESLAVQAKSNFVVIFIDYGSSEFYENKVGTIVQSYGFASYHYIAHTGLLWNKSKALNYGISQAHTDFVVLADIDILFAPNFIESLKKWEDHKSFTLFKINYLSKDVSNDDMEVLALSQLMVSHQGNTFGIGLFPRTALFEVRGLDTFFHFYGSEDEDLNSRLESAGYEKRRCKDNLLWHQWHTRFTAKRDKVMSQDPMLKNIRRINQRHFLWHKELGISLPHFSENWNKAYQKSDKEALNFPTKTYSISNLQAHVMHFIYEILPSAKGHVVKVIFSRAPYYKSLKYILKKVVGQESQTFIDMKSINDAVLAEIIYRYRDYNYMFEVASDLKSITFTIDLKQNNS